jgi:hypothetical protein
MNIYTINTKFQYIPDLEQGLLSSTRHSMYLQMDPAKQMVVGADSTLAQKQPETKASEQK